MINALINTIHRRYGLSGKPDSSKGYLSQAGESIPVGYTNLNTERQPWGDPTLLNEVYELLPYAKRSIDLVSTSLASIPLKIWKGSDKRNRQELTDRPEFNVLARKPNTVQTKFEFYQESISRLQLQGELFWELNRGSRLDSQKITDIYADWRSEQVRIKPHPQEMIEKFRVNIGGEWVWFDREEVYFMRNFNPYDQIRGIAPLMAARMGIGLNLMSYAYFRGYYDKGGKVPGILSTDQTLGDGEPERMQKSFERTYQGIDNMHRTPVLWKGLKFQALGDHNREEWKLALMQLTEKEQVESFGVPQEIFGFGKKTYENMDQAHKGLWVNTLMPLGNRFAEHITCFFIPLLMNRPDPLVYAEFDYSGVEYLQEDKDTLAGRFFQGIDKGVVTRNEARVHVFGFDESPEPHMNELKEPQAPPSLMPGNDPEDDTDPDEEDEKSIEERLMSVVKRFGPAKMLIEVNEEPERDKAWHEAAKSLDVREDRLKKIMVAFFGRMREEYMPRLMEKMNAYDSLEVFYATPPGVLNKDLNAALDVAYWIEQLSAELGPELQAILFEAGQKILDLQGVETLEFNLNHPDVLSSAGDRLKLSTNQIIQTTEEQIRETIRYGIANKLSLDAIADRINEKVFDFAGQTRSARISRTEAMYASNNGNLQGMIQGGFERKMWVSSRDDGVRATHRLMDGKVKNIHDMFLVPDEGPVPFPQAINERCITLPTTTEVN